jgi:uncharacterized Zn finger protein (UPF0148 family)
MLATCPNCGAIMDYDSSSGCLICPICVNKQANEITDTSNELGQTKLKE